MSSEYVIFDAKLYLLNMDIILNDQNRKLEKLYSFILDNDADACIITSPVNKYWIYGIIFDGYLYIEPDKEPLLFVRRPVDLKQENVITIRKPEQIPDLLHKAGRKSPKHLFLENDSLSYNSSKRLQTAFDAKQVSNISVGIRKMRSVKSEFELNQIRESAKIHVEIYDMIPSLYRVGMTDIELQIEIERQMRLHGSVGIFRSYGDNMDIYMGSMLAGDNAQKPSPFDFALGGEGFSPLLPIGANNTLLLPGMTLMVDMAGNFRPYMDDMSRTFAIEHAPEAAYNAHQVSIDIHNAVCNIAKAGTVCSEIFQIAEEIVKENNLQSNFMGTIQQAKFIGHGVGLEINEPPVLTHRSKETLEPGVAFALEPKFVLPGIGAVGIENTYIVNQHGLEKVTICNEEIVTLK